MMFVKRINLAILILLLGLLVVTPSALAVDIRVLLGTNSSEINLGIAQGDYQIFDGATGLVVASVSDGDAITVNRASSSYYLSVNGKNKGILTGPVQILAKEDDSLIAFNSKKYRGSFLVNQDGSSLLAINKVDIEYYLYGVVGEEIGYSTPIEALKAQAVASRSFALASRNSNAKYDVKCTSSSQVYTGYIAETYSYSQNVLAAVNATEGEVIWYKNPNTGQKSIAPAYYHANGGGYTEDIANVWNSTVFPFTGVPSPGDSISPTYQWQVTYSADQVASLAQKYSGKDIGQLEKINVIKTDNSGNPTVSGRAYKVEIVGSGVTVSATKDSIRSLLGLKSTLFDLTYGFGVWLTNSAGNLVNNTTPQTLKALAADGTIHTVNGKATDFYVIDSGGTRSISKTAEGSGDDIVITGSGYGHGVGMSQWGAKAMAQNGSTYQKIISHYYCGDGKNTAFYLGDVSGD